MKTKKGVTAVVFDKKNDKAYFLLMHRVLNWKGWEFVKGGIDKNETPEEAVLREVEEETGLVKVAIISRLTRKIVWTHNGTRYDYIPFLIKANMEDKINLDQEIIEHDNHAWVDLENALAMLTHKDNKKILEEAVETLKNLGWIA